MSFWVRVYHYTINGRETHTQQAYNEIDAHTLFELISLQGHSVELIKTTVFETNSFRTYNHEIIKSSIERASLSHIFKSNVISYGTFVPCKTRF